MEGGLLIRLRYLHHNRGSTLAAVRGTALASQRAASVCHSEYPAPLVGQRGLPGRQPPLLVAPTRLQGQAAGDAISGGRSLAGRQNLNRRDAP